MPSLPATTQDALHSPQTRRSFPSFTQPHFEAATASIDGGLLAYVVSLYVARRERNEGRDDGRYSAVGGNGGAGVCDCDGNLNVNASFVFDAARFRMAVRCGVLFVFADRLAEARTLRKSKLGPRARMIRRWRLTQGLSLILCHISQELNTTSELCWRVWEVGASLRARWRSRRCRAPRRHRGACAERKSAKVKGPERIIPWWILSWPRWAKGPLRPSRRRSWPTSGRQVRFAKAARLVSLSQHVNL